MAADFWALEELKASRSAIDDAICLFTSFICANEANMGVSDPWETGTFALSWAHLQRINLALQLVLGGSLRHGEPPVPPFWPHPEIDLKIGHVLRVGQ